MGLYYGWGRNGTRPSDRAPARCQRFVAPASFVVDVLDDLPLADGADLGGEVTGTRGGIDVAARLGAAQRAGGGQSRLDARVGRVPVDVGRVGDFLHPGPSPPPGLPREHAPADPSVAAARDRDPEDADDDEHP